MSNLNKTFTALTSAIIVFTSLLAQEDEIVPCPVAKNARMHTRDALENRLSQLKLQLELSDSQVRKLEVAAKRLINQQPKLKFPSGDLKDQPFFQGNPTNSEFWKKVEKKTLTEEQLNRLAQRKAAIEKQIASTTINELAALSSPDTMTQFHLPRWQMQFQLSDDQVARIEPILRERLQHGVEDARYPLEVLPELDEAEVLSNSQFRLLKQLLDFKTVAFLEREWKEVSCAVCHTN